MVAYNFQARFADAVASGEKFHTIRAPRKRHAKLGERVQLYTGMRRKTCRKLVDPDPICVQTMPVIIRADTFVLNGHEFNAGSALADGLSQADGFDDFIAMRDWFQETHGLPFTGLLIRWVYDPNAHSKRDGASEPLRGSRVTHGDNP